MFVHVHMEKLVKEGKLMVDQHAKQGAAACFVLTDLRSIYIYKLL